MTEVATDQASARLDKQPVALEYAGVLITLGIVFTIAVAVFGVFFAPHWFVSRTLTGLSRVTADNDVRNTWLKLSAGVAAAFAAVLAWGRLELSKSQDTLSRRQEQLALRQYSSDLFTKAVEQLGHAEPSVRMGGLYSLAEQAHAEERQTTGYEIIAAFVRDQADRRRPKPGQRGESAVGIGPPGQHLAVDLRTAIRLLGQRPSKTPADLSGAYLAYAKLSTANLTGVNLAGASLVGAELEGANLQRANLQRANLERARLEEADFREADLRSARLKWADLLWGKLESALLSYSDFQGAILISADLRGADLERANLENANLEGANLRGAGLRGANLKGAYLVRACLVGADLSNADLEGSNLEFADLHGADLEGAHLQGAINLQRRDS